MSGSGSNSGPVQRRSDHLLLCFSNNGEKYSQMLTVLALTCSLIAHLKNIIAKFDLIGKGGQPANVHIVLLQHPFFSWPLSPRYSSSFRLLIRKMCVCVCRLSPAFCVNNAWSQTSPMIPNWYLSLFSKHLFEFVFYLLLLQNVLLI